MDFNHIPNFRPLTAISSEPELPAVLRVENSARPGRDSSSRKQNAAPQDDDFATLSGETPVEASSAESESSPDGTINFFA